TPRFEAGRLRHLHRLCIHHLADGDKALAWRRVAEAFFAGVVDEPVSLRGPLCWRELAVIELGEAALHSSEHVLPGRHAHPVPHRTSYSPSRWCTAATV